MQLVERDADDRMNCELEESPLGDGTSWFRCPRCRQSPFLARTGCTPRQNCLVSPPPGAGTELLRLIKELSLEPTSACQCEFRVRQMDAWGVEGCRGHRAEIVGWLWESLRGTNWADTISAYKKLRRADWFRRLDPVGSVVDEATRRAENAA